jgi:hypothetical protein
MAVASIAARTSALTVRIASRSSGGTRDSRSSIATIRVNASVVTQNPVGTGIPSIRASSPRLAPLPPTSATCVRSISSNANTERPIRCLPRRRRA